MTFAESSDFLQTRESSLLLDQERLRDEFAKTALLACYESAIKTLENEGFPDENWRVGVALDAYQMADAMLIARNIER